MMSGDDGMFDDWRANGDIRSAIRDALPDEYEDPERMRGLLEDWWQDTPWQSTRAYRPRWRDSR